MSKHTNMKEFAKEYLSKKLEIDKSRFRNGGVVITSESEVNRSVDMTLFADDKNRWWTTIAVEVGCLTGGDSVALLKKISWITNCFTILVWFPYGNTKLLYELIKSNNPSLETKIDDIYGIHANPLNMKGKLQTIQEVVDNKPIFWFSKQWQSIDNLVWVCPDCNVVVREPKIGNCVCKLPKYTVEEQLEIRKKEMSSMSG